MPVLDGIGAARAIVAGAAERGLWARPVMVALSANVSAEDRRLSLEAGMMRHLVSQVSCSAALAASFETAPYQRC